MNVVWSAAAWADVGRIYAFLAEHDLDAADHVFDTLLDAPSRLLDFPRRGSRISTLRKAEVRELRVGRYIVRYGLTQTEILILRIFHGRENRP